MSLRTDVHAAVDDLAPSTSGLADRVLHSVLHEARIRPVHRKAGRFAVPLSLVAVVILIALLLGVLVGGRLVTDWQRWVQRSVNVGVDQAQLHVLEARTLKQPLVQPGDPCTGGPWDLTTGWWGVGQVFVNSPISTGYGPIHRTAWGVYAQFYAETSRTETGPILIRGRDLVSGAQLVFVGQYTSGRIVGEDTLNGARFQQRSEIVLDTANPPPARNAGFVEWSFTVGVREDVVKPSAGNLLTLPPIRCTGWQIDGNHFSETFEVPI